MSKGPWLTRAQVGRIEWMLEMGYSSRQIQRLAAVSQGTVSNIRNRRILGRIRELHKTTVRRREQEA